MSNISVKFIDRDYSVPEDLLVYLDLLDLTNDVRMALNKSFYQILRNEEVGCIGDEQIRPEIDKQVGRFIAKLMEAGVYDRTVTDYLNGNNAKSALLLAEMRTSTGRQLLIISDYLRLMILMKMTPQKVLRISC